MATKTKKKTAAKKTQKPVSDWAKAKLVAETLPFPGQEVVEGVQNIRAFQKYLYQFSAIERKEFTTKQVEGGVRVTRIDNPEK